MDIGSRGRVCPPFFLGMTKSWLARCGERYVIDDQGEQIPTLFHTPPCALYSPPTEAYPHWASPQVWGGGGIQTPGCVVIVYEDTSSWEDGLGRLPAMKRAPEFCNAPCPESRLPAQRVEPQKSRSSVQREQSNARVSARYDQSASSLPRSRSPAAVSRCANTARYSPPQGHQELPCQTSMRCCRRRDTHDSNHPPSATRRCRGRFSAC